MFIHIGHLFIHTRLVLAVPCFRASLTQQATCMCCVLRAMSARPRSNWLASPFPRIVKGCTHTHTHTHTHTCYLRWPGKECVQAFSGTEYMHTCTHSTWSHSIPFLHVSFLSLFSFPLHVPFLLQLLAVTAMLGGTCTLIGTSTNLVVAGFQQNRYPDDPKLSNMGIFDIAPYGLIYASW